MAEQAAKSGLPHQARGRARLAAECDPARPLCARSAAAAVPVGEGPGRRLDAGPRSRSGAFGTRDSRSGEPPQRARRRARSRPAAKHLSRSRPARDGGRAIGHGEDFRSGDRARCDRCCSR